MMRWASFFKRLAVPVLFAGSSVCAAQTTSHPAWALQVTPYVWAARLDGAVSPFQRAPTIGVEKSFREIFDDLNKGGFVDVFARRGAYVLSGDLAYTNISEGHTSGPLPIFDGQQALDGEVRTKQLTATLKGGYRVHQGEREVLELMAGLRYWQIKNDVTLRYSSRSLQYGERFSWVDPLLGARFRYRWNDRWQVQWQGDVGGFGAGSRWTWQWMAALSYNISDHWSAALGYKALRVDYRHDGHVFDSILRGPAFGMTYRF